MKKIVFPILLLIVVSACTQFFAEPDPDKDWLLMEQGNVKLYLKSKNASQTPSPTKEQAAAILKNQNLYYNAIQDSIQKKFKEPVLIYLYNQDQAEEAIGTSTGGLSQPKSLTIYYSFIHDIDPFTDQFGVKDPFIGAHEMVHIITQQTLGTPGTKMMSEGYAVWLDGSYARHSIEEIIHYFRNEHPEFLLSPTELLHETTDEEMVYYPNAGLFIRFLTKTYGTININQLFNTDRDNFIRSFEKQTDTPWDTMEAEYKSFRKRF